MPQGLSRRKRLTFRSLLKIVVYLKLRLNCGT
jgi:hypothetical protein